jgi:hypothetical protein
VIAQLATVIHVILVIVIVAVETVAILIASHTVAAEQF